jgi:4-hydroxy-tetrahydrodipicolinate synthase
MFFGSIPALVTPFSGGRVAEDTLRELVEWQVDQGSNALVPCGTTGESATMTGAEQRRVIELTVEAVAGRVPVIAGCGSNNVAVAIEHLHAAKEARADAALIVTGYYNKPSQAGLLATYRALSEESELPIIVYNIPSRAVVDISVETLAAIAKLPNIAGVKE